MTATQEIRKPKVYMSEREMKRIFNLPRQASDALDLWKHKNLEQKGEDHGTTTNEDAK